MISKKIMMKLRYQYGCVEDKAKRTILRSLPFSFMGMMRLEGGGGSGGMEVVPYMRLF